MIKKIGLLLFVLIMSLVSFQSLIGAADISREWTEAERVDSGTDYDKALYAYVDSTDLYIMVRSPVYGDYKVCLSVESDNPVGFHKSYIWGNAAINYMINDEKMYVYNTDTASTSAYSSVVTNVSISKGTVLDVKVPLSAIGNPSAHDISIGFMSDASDTDNNPTIPSFEQKMVPIAKKAITIPYPVGMVIDDLGWAYTYDPLDTAIDAPSRDVRLSDYQNIIEVGKNVGTRIMTVWILRDLDRYGAATDPQYNPPYFASYLTDRALNNQPPLSYSLDLMEMVKNNAAYLEFGMHGLGHGNYVPNPDPNKTKPVREGEGFAKIIQDGLSEPWPDSDITNKLNGFLRVIRQYFDEETCSFPQSFVPPSHGYYYIPGGNNNTGSFFAQYGLKYGGFSLPVSTSMTSGTIDNGVICIDRAFGPKYYRESATPWVGDPPRFEPGVYPSDSYGWIEAHMPNYWNDHSKDYNDAVQNWSDYLTGINNSIYRVLPPNTAMCSSQWLYYNHAKFKESENSITINTLNMPDDAYKYEFLYPVIIKFKLDGKHLSYVSSQDGLYPLGYSEDEFGFGYLTMGTNSGNGGLGKGNYKIDFRLGDTPLNTYVDTRKSTYVLKEFNVYPDSANVSLELYGEQEVRVKLPFIPKSLNCDNRNATALSANYDLNTFTMTLKGKNIQGESVKVYLYDSEFGDFPVNVSENAYVSQNADIVQYTEFVQSAEPVQYIEPVQNIDFVKSFDITAGTNTITIAECKGADISKISVKAADGGYVAYVFDSNAGLLSVKSDRAVNITVSTDTFTFADVSGYEWPAQSIYSLASRNAINKNINFHPNNSLTRSEAIKMAITAFGLPDKTVLGFADLPDMHWAVPYIKNGQELDGSITPTELAALYYNAAIRRSVVIGKNSVTEMVYNVSNITDNTVTRAEAARLLFTLYKMQF